MAPRVAPQTLQTPQTPAAGPAEPAATHSTRGTWFLSLRLVLHQALSRKPGTLFGHWAKVW